MVDILTFGESMARLSATRIGPLRHSPELRMGIAGAESNVAVGALRLGRSARWLGRVGDDEFGRLICATLRGEGVELDAITDPEAPTGLLVKERRTAGTTRVLYYRDRSAGSRLSSADVEGRADDIAAARVLHITGITPALSDSARAATARAVQIARAAGTTISLDVNYRRTLWSPAAAAEVLSGLAAEADIVFAGIDEARLLVDGVDASSLARALAHRYGAQAIVKRGAEGAIAVVDGEEFSAPVLRVPEIDPIGAGDAFTAGYLSDFLDGAAPELMLDTAARCGAFAVTVDGDWEGLPSRGDLSTLDSVDVHR